MTFPRLCPLLLTLLLAFTAFGCGGDPEWLSPYDATNSGWMMNVGGSGASDLYSVGGTRTSASAPRGEGVITHFDGTEWREVDHGLDIPMLNWVHANASDDVWAVGRDGTIVHFDGAAWSEVESPTERELWGVWGSSATDIWAVGGDAAPEPGREPLPEIIRYDGNTWSIVEFPELMRRGVRSFFKVWGSSASDVWIVGMSGVVLHYDGSTFTEEFIGADVDLVSVWGTGPNQIAIVGGRGNGWAYRYNGAWQAKQVEGLPGLNGVWMRGDTIHAVGAAGTILRLDFETLETIGDDSLATRNDFHAVFGTSDGLVTVGGNLSNPAGPFQGTLQSREFVSGD